VAERVVDALEFIDLDIEDGELLAAARGKLAFNLRVTRVIALLFVPHFLIGAAI